MISASSMCQYVIVCKILLTAQPLNAPKELEVYAEGGFNDFGVWKMNIEWKGDFTNSITADKVTYDIKIFYTEQMKLVHNVSRCLYNKVIFFSFRKRAFSHRFFFKNKYHRRANDEIDLIPAQNSDCSETHSQ